MTHTYLTETELSSINLPKWPGCDVDGDSVTPEQAMEILVRTNGCYFSTNDGEFEKEVKEIFYTTISHPEWEENWWNIDGCPPEEFRVLWYRLTEYHKEMGILDIDYLVNQRVCSAYIGGPHGWCDWNGNIFQRGMNVGKWPSATEIFNEWKTIAKAFPFLRLTCRLLNHEAGYSEGNPGIAVVYEVENGEVKARKPEESDLSLISQDDSQDFDLVSMFNDPHRERGVSPLKWRKACELVAQKQTV